MHSYSKEDLYNKQVQDEASEAYFDGSISKESYTGIVAGHTTSLYTPNFFIKVALAVLTLVAIIFSGVLLGLVFQMSLVPLFLIFSLINYAALELLVAGKKYYNAGVDNVLMFFSAALMTTAFSINHYAGYDVVASAVAVLTCLYLSVRFTDAFMAEMTYLALLTFIFLFYTKIGSVAKATAPFLLIIVSGAIYGMAKKLIQKEQLFFYSDCFKWILQLTLITGYAVGNYYIIKELSNEIFDLNLSLNDTIPFGWFFWIWTFAVPVFYVAHGIRKVNLTFIRTGLVAFAATIFTFRYYYHVVQVEIAMLTAGLILVAVSYAIIKFLKSPSHGFSCKKPARANKEKIDLKALILTQVAAKKASSDTGVEFGGGSFGGGGAAADY